VDNNRIYAQLIYAISTIYSQVNLKLRNADKSCFFKIVFLKILPFKNKNNISCKAIFWL